jgi:predicted phosphohydrolase
VRIAWLTDIHLDHLEDTAIDHLSVDVAQTAPDAVVVTGDISVAPRIGQDLERFIGAFDAPVYFVAGNHDYWGANVKTMRTFFTHLPEVVPRLRWLGATEPVLLDSERALVGVDGWADARLGDRERSPVRLADYAHIADLKGDFEAGVATARSIADEDAQQLGELLERALRLRPHVYVATHVPPFAEAARYHGVITSPAFLPWVTSQAIGDALLEAADRHPRRRLTVLCGHMHHPAHVWPRPNLEVRCGAAAYGAPTVGDVLVLE